MLAELKMRGRQVKLYQMQGLLHYFAMLSDTQSYLSIVPEFTRHFRQASPKKAEQLMIIVVVVGTDNFTVSRALSVWQFRTLPHEINTYYYKLIISKNSIKHYGDSSEGHLCLQNVGLLSIQAPDAAASLKISYCI